MNDAAKSDKIDEIVVCHEMHEVPVENTSFLLWAATRTFTIRYLEDDAGGGGIGNSHNISNTNSSETNLDCNQNGMITESCLNNSNTNNYDNNTCNSPIVSNGVTCALPIICDSFSPTYSINPERITTVPLETPYTDTPKVSPRTTTGTAAVAINSTSITFTNGKRPRCGSSSSSSSSSLAPKVVQIPPNWTEKSIKTEPPEAGTSKNNAQENTTLNNETKNMTLLTPSSTSSSSESGEDDSKNAKKLKTNQNRLLKSPICCGVCDRKFSCMNKFHEHHLKHFGYSTKNFVQRQCCFCNHYFKSMQNLRLHLIIPYNQNRVRCKKCKQLYVKSNVDTHECRSSNNSGTNS